MGYLYIHATLHVLLAHVSQRYMYIYVTHWTEIQLQPDDISVVFRKSLSLKIGDFDLCHKFGSWHRKFETQDNFLVLPLTGYVTSFEFGTLSRWSSEIEERPKETHGKAHLIIISLLFTQCDYRLWGHLEQLVFVACSADKLKKIMRGIERYIMLTSHQKFIGSLNIHYDRNGRHITVAWVIFLLSFLIPFNYPDWIYKALVVPWLARWSTDRGVGGSRLLSDSDNSSLGRKRSLALRSRNPPAPINSNQFRFPALLRSDAHHG